MPYGFSPAENYVDIKYDEHTSSDIPVGVYPGFDHKFQPSISPYHNNFLTPYSPNDSVPESDPYDPRYNNDAAPDMGDMDTMNVVLDSSFCLPHDLPDGLHAGSVYNSDLTRALGSAEPHVASSTGLRQLQIPSLSQRNIRQLSAGLNHDGDSTLPSGSYSVGASPYTTTSESTLNTPMTDVLPDSQTFPLPPPIPCASAEPAQVDCYCKEESDGTAVVSSVRVSEYPSLFSPSVTGDFGRCSLGGMTPSQSSSKTEIHSDPIGNWIFAQEDAYGSYTDDFPQLHDIARLMSQDTLNELPVESLPPRKVATERVVAHARSRRKNPNQKGQYICYICGRDFTAPHNLKHHLNSHKGEKPYRCKHCRHSFTTPRSLKRHTKTKHEPAGYASSSIASLYMTEVNQSFPSRC
ncbi:hypothetical protein VKT23_009095 [Stygiomarasmius scandens]|uniref:C2H2-type domain-containing protein n=1 Tax=Marasmiellus scandens TaxID=2682957 RepID=A0ABR1JF15_9AGAR